MLDRDNDREGSCWWNHVKMALSTANCTRNTLIVQMSILKLFLLIKKNERYISSRALVVLFFLFFLNLDYLCFSDIGHQVAVYVLLKGERGAVCLLYKPVEAFCMRAGSSRLLIM